MFKCNAMLLFTIFEVIVLSEIDLFLVLAYHFIEEILIVFINTRP
jgi:hypothetical protein